MRELIRRGIAASETEVSELEKKAQNLDYKELERLLKLAFVKT